MKPVLAPAGSRLTPALVAAAWGLLAILILYGTLLAPSYYEDNRYNLGLVRRSALPTSQHLLETSLAHLYVLPYPLPRAEDWHLSLPLILLTGWTKLIGPSREWALRIPHLFWVCAWLFLAVQLLRTLREPTPAGAFRSALTRPSLALAVV